MRRFPANLEGLGAQELLKRGHAGSRVGAKWEVAVEALEAGTHSGVATYVQLCTA